MIIELSALGDIDDLLGSMVLWMPDKTLPNTDLGLGGAFEWLNNSLKLVRGKLGEERYSQLIGMARQSKQLFVDGDDLGGREILADMKDVLRNKKP